MRCQDARSLITSKLTSLKIRKEERIVRQANYNDLALKTYIRGLPPNIQTNVRLRNPENLEKAMSLVVEEENFLYATQKQSSINSQTSFRPESYQIEHKYHQTIHHSEQTQILHKIIKFLNAQCYL